MANISIYLTNLGKYNEGSLIGEWVSLPVDEDELNEVLKRIGINEEYEEYFITDYDSDIPGLYIGEYDSLSELNEIAEQIEDMDPDCVEAAMYFYSNRQEALENVENIVYIGQTGRNTAEEIIGYYFAKECGCLNIPEEIENYFDFEAYGRGIMIKGSFYENEKGEIYELIA